MSDEEDIHEILIDRDIRAFIAGDWSMTAADFDADFAACSARSGEMRLAYPNLEAYRDDWIGQARLFAGTDPVALGTQLRDAQRLTRVDVAADRALATKVFDGSIDSPDGPIRLDWTSHYFLHRDAGRWRITGFAGYMSTGASR